MTITENNEKYYLQAMKVDFLSEHWEMEWYTLALMKASAWGEKIDKQNKEYFPKNHLIDKYNV